MIDKSDYLITTMQINFIPVNKLDRFTHMGFYEMDRGKFVEYIRQHISKEKFNSLGFNQLDSTESIIQLLNYVYHHVYKLSNSVQNFHINLMDIDMNYDMKMQNRYMRLNQLLKKLEKMSGIKSIPIQEDKEDKIDWTTNIYLSNKLVLNVHPKIFRLIGRTTNGQHVIARKRVPKTSTTGIDEFKDFLNYLDKERLIPRNDKIYLIDVISTAFNLRYKI